MARRDTGPVVPNLSPRVSSPDMSALAFASVCDNCNVAPAALFCTADGAYLCNRCDLCIHSANKLAMRHERISVATKMSRDALECRPCTYEIPVLTGVPQRTRPGPGLGDGNSMSDMDWLVMVGEDPLSNLMNMEEQERHADANGGSRFTLNDDLFGIEATIPSDMFSGHSSSSHHVRPAVTSEREPVAGMESTGTSTNLGAARGKHAKLESATSDASGASGASNTTQALVAAGGSAMGSEAEQQQQLQHQQQQQQRRQQQQEPEQIQQQQLGSLGGAAGGEVEAVLTRPFATSALRHAQLQRYRTKRLARHQGHKKIRYECRKTLADSRPRVKGRFVRVQAGDGAGAGDGAPTLSCVQSCPDLMALARLPSETAVGRLEDVPHKKSRLCQSSSANSDGAADVNSMASPRAPTGGRGGHDRRNSGGGLHLFKGWAGEEMADSALLGEIGIWGDDGGGGMGFLRGGAGRAGMPHTQSEVSLVALDRAGWG